MNSFLNRCAELSVEVVDELKSMYLDFIKLKYPNRSSEEVKEIFEKSWDELSDSKFEISNWVYFPWKRKVCHILNLQLYRAVRTIRNKFKITSAEQDLLLQKRIGVVGLSVGQSISITAALESTFGEIRIADFDRLELSNLNRIRTSVVNIGLTKTEIVAREINEIDPYLRVVRFDDGINEQNIDSFLLKDGKLDLVVEECDSVEIKILVRERCRLLGIPVLMDMSDRGMIDIERYDLDRSYPLLHGNIPEGASYDFLKTLRTSEEKLPYLLPMVGYESLSSRMKASAVEVGQTITTWPQLASDVVLGGALGTHLARRILLGDNVLSGRTWVDMEKLFPSNLPVQNSGLPEISGELTPEVIDHFVAKYDGPSGASLSDEEVRLLFEAAVLAPSPGNMQNWMWAIKDGVIFCFLKNSNRNLFGDHKRAGSIIALGCAAENISEKGLELGLEFETRVVGDNNSPLIAVLIVSRGVARASGFSEFIGKRYTYRGRRTLFNWSLTILDQLETSWKDKSYSLHWIKEESQIKLISDLVCRGDRIRLLNEHGHKEFFNTEVRWSSKEAKIKGDGLDLSLFDISPSDIIGLRLVSDPVAVEHLRLIKGGAALQKISAKSFNEAEAIGLISIPSNSISNWFEVGRYIQHLWLKSTSIGLGWHPMTVLQMLFLHLEDNANTEISTEELNAIVALREQLDGIIPELKGRQLAFLFRLTPFAVDEIKTFRRTWQERVKIF